MDILAELFKIRKTVHFELRGKSSWRHAQRTAQTLLESIKPGRSLLKSRAWQIQSQLEATPNGPVKQLCVVGCRHDHHMTGQCVDLQEQGTDDALDFASFVGVAAFLAKSIELIEKNNNKS